MSNQNQLVLEVRDRNNGLSFVKRVSEENLIQLLDGLETDGVFNLLEKRAKLEENQSTANKARDTIDAVRMKGQTASEMMIKRLHHIDPTLSNQLGLSSDSSAKGETRSSFKLLL
uniref:CARD domain-containing protein n=1 Tax=Poecilia latipinna TaxID=48699 RepID=A0A3B3U4V4_9TELE